MNDHAFILYDLRLCICLHYNGDAFISVKKKAKSLSE